MSALVVQNFEAVSLSITGEAQLRKQQAIQVAQKQTEVVDCATQETAAQAISQLKRVLKDLEASRTAVKAPVLALGKAIDDKAKEFAAELTAEVRRLEQMVQGFFRREKEKADRLRKMAEDIARKKREAAEAEAARLEAEAQKAKTDEEHAELSKAAGDAAEAAENIEAKEVAAPAKATKMTVRKVWKFRVTDIKALFAAKPECCLLEERPYVINGLIRGGMHECPGLEIWAEDDITFRS